MKAEKIYSINEISQITGLPAHTIRFWEKDFSNYLKPFKTPGGQRRYGDGDIETLKKIKHLRYQDKYTIAGTLKELDRYERRVSIAEEINRSNDNTYETLRVIGKTQHDIRTESIPSTMEKK